VTAFTTTTAIKPRLVVYYSGWFEPFEASFATTVAEHGAVPLVQINPTDISLASIASGRYDGYLSSYAEAVWHVGLVADAWAVAREVNQARRPTD
jgi:hypothetical protein